MQTFLYNLNTQQREGPVREGRYLVDGVPGPLPDFLIEVELVVLPDPPCDYATQTLEHKEYLDLHNKKWIKEPYIRNLLPVEIEQRAPQGPTSCTPRQFRLALLQSGILLSDIENAINSIPDPLQRDITKTEWEYALEINKYHPLISHFATLLNISPAQINDIFNLANTL